MINKHSNEWVTIKAYLEEKLQHFRVQNDSNKLNSEATSYLRGRICEIKELLNLPEQKEVPTIKKVDYNY